MIQSCGNEGFGSRIANPTSGPWAIVSISNSIIFSPMGIVLKEENIVKDYGKKHFVKMFHSRRNKAKSSDCWGRTMREKPLRFI